MPNDTNPPEGISTRIVSPSAVSADPRRRNDYDSFAEAYSAENDISLIGSYYNRPAILDLARPKDRRDRLFFFCLIQFAGTQ